MTAPGGAVLSRRSLLWASALGVLAGCSAGAEWLLPDKPVDIKPYAVLPGEVEPACKVAAVRALEAALTWRDGQAGLAAAQRRVKALGVENGAVAQLAPLLKEAAWSSLRVTYPQYGGLLANSASVMVVCEQFRPGNAPQRSITVDARLVRRNGAWTVTDLLLSAAPPPAPQLSDVARQALARDRIVLPATARQDVESGLVDDLVLTMLLELSQRWRLDVLVFSTGHPFNVFGTDRQSNHTRGRAVDVWAIDGIPVIDQDRAPWRAAMEAAAAVGATEIGGPQDIDRVRGRPYFADPVHQDHLHIGFEPTR